MKNTFRCAVISVSAVLVLASLPAFCSEPTAVDLAKSVSRVASSINTMLAQYDINLTTKGPGGEHNINVPVVVALEKPNRFRIDVTGSLFPVTIVSDGEKLWTYVPGDKEATCQTAPGSISLSNQADMKTKNVLNVVSTVVLATLTQAGKVLGTENLNGKETYLVQVDVPAQFSAKLWIGKDDYYLYKAETSLDPGIIMSARKNPKTNETSVPKPSEKGSATATIVARTLKVNQPIPADTFQFRVPDGVTVVERSEKTKNSQPDAPSRNN